MKDILEYSKQAPNDYPFVYQDTMERMFSEDLNGALEDYEERLLENVSKLREDYNILRKEPRYRRPLNYERFFDIPSGEIRNLLLATYSYAFKTGGQQAYKDFNQDKEFLLDLENIVEISRLANQHQGKISKSYQNLVLSKLRVAFNNDYSSGQFLDDLKGYKDFKKAADSSYTPSMPNKKNIVDNYSTREVSRHVNDGRMAGYGKTQRVLKYIYKTRADERVSSKCAPWHNRVLDPAQAKAKIPQHRNCRCTIVPYI